MTKKDFKQELLNALYSEYKNCRQCPLATPERTNIVFGRGNADAQILFIGEAPGKDEDLQGIPFIGKSGTLLSKIFKTLSMDENALYLTNIVKCRPHLNRAPEATEIKICKKILLDKQIEIINPSVICTFGSYATNTLLKSTFKISEIRGKTYKYKAFTLIPSYHPAFILRSPKNLPSLLGDIKKAYDFANSNKNKS